MAPTGAYPTGDIPFWFGTLDAFNLLRRTRVWGPDDYRLSGMMMDALVAFAATGNPSSKAVQWPAWSPSKEVMLEWGGKELAAVVPMDVSDIEWLKAHPARHVQSGAGLGRSTGGPRD